MPTTLHTAAPPTNVIMTASLRQDVGSASLSATANAMANLRTTRDELSDESRTSKRNHAHVTLELASVRDELGKLRAILKADRATLATFASKIQPIIRLHELGVAQLKTVYDQAREGHARAVDVIKKEFGVRPRRPGNASVPRTRAASRRRPHARTRSIKHTHPTGGVSCATTVPGEAQAEKR